MRRTDPLLVDTTRRVLRAVADLQARHGGDDAGRRAAAWRGLEDNGLTRAWLPEALGGAGAGISDGFAILTLAGEVALDIPLAETLLAGWMLAAAGLSAPDGALAPVAAVTALPGAASGASPDAVPAVPVSASAAASDRTSDRTSVLASPVGSPGGSPLASGNAGDIVLEAGRLRGRAAAVPFAREAAHLAVLGRRGAGEGGVGFVALVERAACSVEPRDNLAGEPRDMVILDGATPAAVAPAPDGLGERLLAMGAVARACQMAGALQAILARSVTYAGDRIAFDRPIGKFQAIQHALARLAGETAAALAASGSAADALADPTCDAGGLLLEVAGAKIRVGEAAAAGAAIAHQVHGAIGFSTEHALHRFTRRLWAWRDDFGSETAWAVRLGSWVADRGADALWPMLAAR
jgi:acyl-CoA dehydrogenase